MSEYNYLVTNDEIQDISYRTEQREETIYPRVVEESGAYYVYCQKEKVTLDRFLHRLANDEDGLWVAGYRKASGKKVQSTITFSKKERVRISPRLQRILDDIKAGTSSSATKPIPDEIDKPLSLEELQERLKRQAEVGLLGEHAAYRHEYLRLTRNGCSSPGDHIKQLSVEDVSAGYDLRSEFNGEVRCIEVKSSTTRTNTFFISENERIKLSDLQRDAYIYLVRVDERDDKNSHVFREIQNPFGPDELLTLEPTAWFAKISDK